MIDLSQYKSAVIMTDPAEIAEAMVKSFEQRTKSLPTLRQRETQMFKDAEGRTGLRKYNAKASGSIAVPEIAELKSLCEKRDLPWNDAFVGRCIPYFGSDERPDGHGDIVLQNFNFSTFEDNPVLADSHRWENPPIGNMLDWKVVQRVDAKYNGPALWLLSLFTPAEVYAWGDQIFRLVNSRFLRGFSIGFVSNKVIDIKDEAERAKLGLGKWGYILDDNELLEGSPTQIGANPGAFSILARAKSLKQLEAKDFTVIRELARRQEKDESTWEVTDENLLSFAKILFPEHEYEEHKGLENPLIEEPVAPKKNQIPVDDRIDKLQESVDALTLAVDELAKSLGQKVSDIRDGVESLQTELEDGAISDLDLTDGLLENADFLSDDGSDKSNS